MYYRLLADVVLVVHLAFVVFVALGGLLVLRWPALAWVHLPAVVWGVFVELAAWICPLTPLEQRWRARAGEGGYEGGFIDHYVTLWLYPAGLTRGAQLALGFLALALNLAIYAVLFRRRRLRSV